MKKNVMMLAVSFLLGTSLYAQEIVLSQKDKQDAKKYQGIESESCMPIVRYMEALTKESKVSETIKNVTTKEVEKRIYIGNVKYSFYEEENGWEKLEGTVMETLSKLLKDLQKTTKESGVSLSDCSYIGQKSIDQKKMNVYKHNFNFTMKMDKVYHFTMEKTDYIGINDGKIYHSEEVALNNPMGKSKKIIDYRYTDIKKPKKIIE